MLFSVYDKGIFMKIEKCDKCEYVREYYYGKDLAETYNYCGLIEGVCESAIDIKEIKECPKDRIFSIYRKQHNNN